MLERALNDEWLETDGHGGFAMGTAAGLRTRRYHALLVAAPRGGGRSLLVSGLEVTLVTPAGRFALSSQEYEPDVVHPDGWRRIESFGARPWPRWIFRAEDGCAVALEIFCARATRETIVRFELLAGSPSARLEVRPLLAGRDYHALHRENPAFCHDAERRGPALVFRPYQSLPAITLRTSGRYVHAPLFFRSFRYREEAERGLDHSEDLGSPGSIEGGLGQGPIWLAFGYLGAGESDSGLGERPLADELRELERERRSPLGGLELAADHYVVTLGERRSIIAGYPWFTDWGRDTFIALRGLCLATGRLDDALAILSDWSEVVRAGLLPNRFPDGSGEPEYNSVDAALLYAVAVHEYFAACTQRRRRDPPDVRERLGSAIGSILRGLCAGTRYGVRVTEDGLLAAGEPGVQLTWMDAKIGDYVVTPRIGKPVEIQALWLNALKIGAELGAESSAEWAVRYERGLRSFRARFFCAASGCLYDVIDVDHTDGKLDASIRPNQIFAVGGLPHALLPAEQSRAVVERVLSELWTPLGLRTLSPRDGAYRGRYRGGVFDRDTAYHQGTAWPWLLGPFVEAWLRVRGFGPDAKREARDRFLLPWLCQTEQAGLGHVSEIVDGDFPHAPRGAPFQAWSLAELLRAFELVTSER